MEGIEHRTVKVNGINMHIAEKGQGPIILFLHGFPELWYSWRHQILALSSLGYRAVAPDLRGYGDTDAPDSIDSYSGFHIVGDLIALLDAIAPDQEKAFLVGHDWGAFIAWYFCLFRPDRVKALVNLSVPLKLNFDPTLDLVTEVRSIYGDDYYMCRFQEPGDIEAEFAQIPTEFFMKMILSLRIKGPLMFPKVKPSGSPPVIPVPLPSWLSEEDLKYFAGKFEKTGFSGPVNYYRNLKRNFELMAPWAGSQVKVPVKFVIGDEDLVYYMQGVKDYLHNGGFKKDVPLLEEVVVMEGAAHFIQQEKAEEINNHIFDFFQKFI